MALTVALGAQRAIYLKSSVVRSARLLLIPTPVTFIAPFSTHTVRQSEPKRPAQGFFPSLASSSSKSRKKVELICEQIQRALPQPYYQVIATGAYRRGVEDVKEACILVVGLQDEFDAASSPLALKMFNKKKKELASHLVSKGIVHIVEKGSDSIYSDMTGLPIELQYVSKAFHGAALLYHTGDDSYIRFLKLMAMEGMGLTLNELGLWRPLHRRQSQTRRKPATANHGLPAGMALESLDDDSRTTETEGDRQMRATRKEMGLPEGLDLSLDLGPVVKKGAKQERESTMQANSIHSQLDSTSDELVRVKIEKESEEMAILDVLGLVCIPPVMRTVKEPKEVEVEANNLGKQK